MRGNRQQTDFWISVVCGVGYLLIAIGMIVAVILWS
jgi:hypothetical protein